MTHLTAALLLAGGAAARAAGAQETDTTRRGAADSRAADSLAADSLRRRLEELEEAVGLLRQRMAAQAAAEVRTRARASLEIHGRVAATGFWTSGRVNNLDVPQLVLPPSAALPPGATAAPPERALGATLRQSLLGLAVAGLRAGPLDASADVDLDFAGGPQTGSGGRGTFPTPRLRTARAFLRGARGELMVGHDVPLVLGEHPVSVASVSTPLFANAGNLWLWLTQARLTWEPVGAGDGVRLALQGAVLAPNAGEPAPGDPDAVDAAERARLPSLQARARLRWGEDGELGVGAHRGWLQYGDRRRASSLVGADLRLPLGALELRGEAYAGALLRGLGGGGVGQNYGAAAADGVPTSLHDRGGWAQLNVRATEAWLGGAGCGVDDPENDDHPARRRNRACAAHLTWRPGGGWLVGAEAKRLGTDYATTTRWATHAALVMGMEF